MSRNVNLIMIVFIDLTSVEDQFHSNRDPDLDTTLITQKSIVMLFYKPIML